LSIFHDMLDPQRMPQMRSGPGRGRTELAGEKSEQLLDRAEDMKDKLRDRQTT
jgi:hypothetical protein